MERRVEIGRDHGMAAMALLLGMTDAAERKKKDEAEKPAVTGSPQVTYRAGRNEPCPCGSGKKFKRCHG